MAERIIMRDRACLQCGVRPICGTKYCSNQCFNKALYARRAAQPGFAEMNRRKHREHLDRRFGQKPEGSLRRVRIAPHPCAVCGIETVKRMFCSRVCRQRGDASKMNRRKGSSARRARFRAALIERFDPLEILDRDGWRCHICGIKTPKALRGTYEPRAPELDHIIPLSAGGDHSRLNTACCCRSCNIKKSDKPLGQLRLVA